MKLVSYSDNVERQTPQTNVEVQTNWKNETRLDGR
jgi:hypothetical protein